MMRPTALLAFACHAAISLPAIAADAVARIEANAPVNIAGNAPADAYVEARLRPLASDGVAYVVARYQDERNWVGAGLRFVSATGRMQVEIVRMQDGQITRLKQFGRAASLDARFNTVRLEMTGPTLVAYLNGERITNVVDPTPALPGRYGTVAQGAAFEASVPVTGPSADKPARLALARAPQNVQLSVGEAPLRLPVSALGPFRLPEAPAVAPASAPAGRERSFVTQGAQQDAAGTANGALPRRFSATAADPTLLKVEAGEGSLVLTPLAPGATTVLLASLDDPNVLSTVDVRIAARNAPHGAVPKLAGHVTPRIAEREVPADTPLRLRFDAPPSLGGSGGAIRILRRRDGVQVDAIRTGGEADLLGYEGQPLRRALRLQPIAIEGREAIVHLHSARLQPGEDYLVTVDDGVFGGTIEGQPFAGIAKAQGWIFRTRAAIRKGAKLVVDDDGPADFRTVQGALNHAMRYVARTVPVTIEIRNGRYQEVLYLRGKDNITLHGQSREGVVIDALNSDGVNPGSGTAQEARSPGVNGGRALFLIEDADLVTLDNLSIRNSTLRDSPTGGQAEAVFFNSEGRLVAKNASFYSEQDTIQVRGYAWFYRTLIAGNVDYIWGNNHAALFEDSELRTVGGSKPDKGGGYVLQARTVAAGDKGFLFLNSRLTHGPGPGGHDVAAGSTWLARSAGYANAWDHIAFIDCRMGPHIAPEGWAATNVKQPAPNPKQATALAGWRESGTMDLDGKPLDVSRRQFGRVLDAAEARAAYGTRAGFFAGFEDGWDPKP